MRILCFALLLLCAMPTLAKPIAKSVEWGHKNVEMQGYLVYDDASTRLRPGLVMVPNWMGVTDAAV